jgi:3-oxoacyl-[acyl-carrier protein] reductase
VVAINHKIDILINNAGVIYNEPLINITKTQRKHCYETYKKMMDINLNSVFLVSSNVVEQMVMKRTKGVVINISSICAEGNQGQTAYSAAKAGVNAFTKTWAKELGPFGIRVVAISPGFINTESTNRNIDEHTLNALTKRIPLRRLGMADDIAHAVLTAIQNQYINGCVMEVHGGLTI